MKKFSYKKTFPILLTILFVSSIFTPFKQVFALGAEWTFTNITAELNANCNLKANVAITILPSSFSSTSNYVLKVAKQGTSQMQIKPLNFANNGNIPDSDQLFIFDQLSGPGVYQFYSYETSSVGTTIISQNDEIITIDLSQSVCTPATNPNPNPNSNPTSTSTLTTTGDAANVTPILIQNPISTVSDIPKLIQKILEIMIKIGIPLLVVMIVVSGAMYLFARGNPSKISSAHTMLLYTLLGGAILLGAWALSQIIYSTLINITAFIIPYFV